MYAEESYEERKREGNEEGKKRREGRKEEEGEGRKGSRDKLTI